MADLGLLFCRVELDCLLLKRIGAGLSHSTRLSPAVRAILGWCLATHTLRGLQGHYASLVCMCVYTCVCMCVCLCVYTHVCRCKGLCVYTCVCKCICLCVCIHVCAGARACVCVHTYVQVLMCVQFVCGDQRLVLASSVTYSETGSLLLNLGILVCFMST